MLQFSILGHLHFLTLLLKKKGKWGVIWEQLSDACYYCIRKCSGSPWCAIFVTDVTPMMTFGRFILSLRQLKRLPVCANSLVSGEELLLIWICKYKNWNIRSGEQKKVMASSDSTEVNLPFIILYLRGNFLSSMYRCKHSQSLAWAGR